MATKKSARPGMAYRDASLSPGVRAADLLPRMTLEEKIAQLCGCWSAEVITKKNGITLARCREKIGSGIGHVARPAVCSGPVGAEKDGGFRPRELAQQINSIQRFLVRHTRLGIPAIVHEESLSGVTMRGAAMFPQALNYASTWNPELVGRVGDAIRRHMVAVGLRQSLAPLLDVGRDPRWGRIEETFGEDPYLVAAMGCAYIRGLQGSNLAEGVAATGKHFLAYGVPEGGHNVGSVRVGPRELREVHAFPFEAAIRLAGLASVMHAYHEIDGIPCVASRELLTDLLRGELGFDGVVVSDYGALWMLFDAHKVAADQADAARMALHAGLDTEIPDGWGYAPSLAGLVREGKVPMSLLDQAVERNLRLKFKLGLFERPYVEERLVQNNGFDTEACRALAFQAAVESAVLLKNNPALLPLKSSGTIAVIGPNADSVHALLGDYTYANHTSMAQPLVPVPTVLEAIRQRMGARGKLLYAPGCGIKDKSQEGFAAAVATAARADVVVAVMGENSFVWSGENRDRTRLVLPEPQEALLQALRSTGKPVVLVILSGRPLSTVAVDDCCGAILQAWYPGEEGGRAITALLFGDAVPSGRLPISVPKDEGHVPCHYGRRPFSCAGGSVDENGALIRPLYPFGHGLSYTEFSYSKLTISPAEISPDGMVRLSLDVTNKGKRRGVETVQLYLRDPLASVSRPVAELKGFQRVELLPGRSATVTFELPSELVAFFDPAMRLVVEPGLIEVKIGASAEDIRLEGSFRIKGETHVLARRTVFFSSSRVAGKARKRSR